jgi:hypothetical protein
VFKPDLLDKLLSAADPAERPVVGALTFLYLELGTDGMGGMVNQPRPVILDWATVGDEQGFLARASYPVNTLVRCAATGSAAILIHRSVFERMERAPEVAGQLWYDRLPSHDSTPGRMMGEDVSFCVRLGALDIPVWVHTGARTSHHKSTWVTEASYWGSAIAPPATDEVAVLVPVMRRPANAAPFMASLRASTGLATAYAIADLDDEETIAAWSAAGAVIIPWSGGPGTFSEKVNEGYRQTAEPWIFLVGDDVTFHAGWLDHAQAVARSEGAQVVGTADLANPRVMAGEHATHMLIARSYVDEIGASWDGPKIVAHEGYRHWYVDDEIVTAARERGAWGMALGSRVEHLHPRFGKAETDEVYELGESQALADRGLFLRRLRGHARPKG